MTDLYKKEIIDPNDRASRFAHEVCVKSYNNNRAVIVVPHNSESFRGPVGFVWKNHILEGMRYTANAKGDMISWSMLEEIESDGAGGKPQFFAAIGTPEVFYRLGWEIITMTADDFARSKRFPAVIVNEMNVKNITDENFLLFEATMRGYEQALKESNLVNITGEIAIMKNSITAFCDMGSPEQLILTWGATCIGLAHRNLLADNSKIKPGMLIVGFGESGYRCNGGTFLTKVVLNEFGPQVKDRKAIDFIKKLTVPSRSYARTMTRISGWNSDGSIGEPLANIVAAAHITGGGMGKFVEILPPGVSAYLDSMPKPPKVLLEAQEMSWNTDFQLTDDKAYTTFHGGCGMHVVVPTIEDALTVISEAKKDGIKAQVVGETVESKLQAHRVIIESQFKEEGKTVELD